MPASWFCYCIKTCVMNGFKGLMPLWYCWLRGRPVNPNPLIENKFWPFRDPEIREPRLIWLLLSSLLRIWDVFFKLDFLFSCFDEDEISNGWGVSPKFPLVPNFYAEFDFGESAEFDLLFFSSIENFTYVILTF